MALHRGLSALLLSTLVACGGSTFSGLGPDPEDTGDDGASDVIFPTDDGAATDGTLDSTPADTTLPDSAILDDAADSTGADVDDGSADAADTLVDDTADAAVDAVDAPDTTVADGPDPLDAIPDVTPDAVIDASEAGADAADSTVTDTGTPDTGAPDTGAPDTGAPDTLVTDTAPEAGLISTNPNKVYCGNTPGLLCATGQECCGGLSGLSWSYNCADGCSFGQRSFSCNEAADCGGGKVCCGGHPPLSGAFSGSTCRDSCRTFEDQLCMTDAECGAGKHCQAATTADASNQTIGQCK